MSKPIKRAVTSISTKSTSLKPFTVEANSLVATVSSKDLDFNFSTKYKKMKTEYGVHIPTLVEFFEDGYEVE